MKNQEIQKAYDLIESCLEYDKDMSNSPDRYEKALQIAKEIFDKQVSRKPNNIDGRVEKTHGGRMIIHKLKLSADYYDDSASGVKTFEIRKNDRNFKVGDILELREWIWSALEGKGTYTGNVHWKIITYILEDEAFLKEGYVCIAVSPIAEQEGNHDGD